MTRKRLLVVIVAIIVIIAATLVFQPWQYFVVNEVDEAFPDLSGEMRDAIRAMPEAEKDMLLKMADENREMAGQVAAAQTGPDAAAPADEADMPPEMPAEPTVLARGSFIDIDPIHGAVGTATIYALPDGERLLRFEDFRSKNGPDLHVYLSTETPTTTFAGLGADEIHLGNLKGNVGNQNYAIAADVDLSRYKSAVIYCVPFGVVFSTAAFE